MKNLKRLFPYLLKYKKKLLLGFLVVTISNLCSTYVPKLVGETIDLISLNGSSSQNVVINIIYILILTFFSGLFMFFTRRTIIVASREIEYDLRQDLIGSIRDESMTFFHKNSTGGLMAHATNDIPAAREFLGPAIMYSANTITTFLFALYFMLSLDPMITFISLIPLPFIAYLTYLIGKKIHIAFKEVQSQFGELTTHAQETISGIRLIRAFSRELYEVNKFRIISFDYLKKNLRLARIEALFMPLLMVLVGLSQIIVLLYGGFKVINEQATLGDLTQFFIYLELLIWPVAAIGWVTNLIQRGAASAFRLGVILDQKSEIIENVNGADATINKSSITFNNIKFRYNHNSNYVINNINLEIAEGKSLGIVGTVGSGKSTLVNLLARLFDLSDGCILLGNIDIRDISLQSLRGKLGIVPQEPFLFSDTILNNIKFSKPDANIDDVIEISKKVMLYDEILGFEKGFDTVLGERGITLSGGQKQRVAIARAMLKNPDILILDDALSAVDTFTEDNILHNIKKFLLNKTSIIISHRISTVKACDYIVFLDEGSIVEEGTHQQLIQLKGRYSTLFDLQQIAAEIDLL